MKRSNPFLLISFFFIFALIFIPSASATYTIDGDTVYIDDSNVYLSATPHTVASSGWVYFTLTSKQFTGDIDAVWGFNTLVSRPTKAEVYAPHWVNTTTDHEYTFYNVTNPVPYTGDDLDYGNTYNTNSYTFTHEVPTVNEITGEIDGSEFIVSNVGFDSQVPDGNNRTAYWETRHDVWTLWRDKTSSFESVTHDYQGFNKWYYIKDVNVNAGQEYTLRAWIEVPVSLEPQSGKYYYAVKPSDETIPEAVASGHFYALDPWWEAAWDYYKTITINQTMVNQTIGDVHYTMLIDITDTDLRDHALANGDDIVFVDSTNTTQLDHQISTYNTTTGALVAYVNVTDISNINSINMYYGNDAATNTEDKAGTWGVNASAILLIDEGTGGFINDSSGNNINGTLGAGSTWEDGHLSIVGATGTVVFDDIKLLEEDQFTILYGMNCNVVYGSTSNLFVFGGGGGDYVKLYHASYNHGLRTLEYNAYTGAVISGTVTIDDGSYKDVVYQRVDTDVHNLFIDGTLDTLSTTSVATETTTTRRQFNIASSTASDWDLHYIYVYNIALSEDEISTLQNNTEYPALFISVGAEQSDAPPGPDDTSFTVTLPIGYTVINFTATTALDKTLEPDGQTLSVPIVEIENTGNVTQSFRFYINEVVSGITTYASLSNDLSSPIEFNASTTTVIISNLAASTTEEVWMYCNLTQPSPGDYGKELTINSS